MAHKSAQRALFDSTLALLAAITAMAMFLPPLLQATTVSLPRMLTTGLVIALTLPLHWVFLGIAAHRLGRSVARWVGLSVLLFPVGSAAALMLLAWGMTEPGPDGHAALR